MVDTMGGIGGGLARGIEAGTNLFGAIQDRQQRQQQFQQQLGLESRAADRADQEQLLNMNKYGYDLLKDRVADARKQAIESAASYYDDHKDDPAVAPYESTDEGKAQTDSINAMLAQMQKHADKILAPAYYGSIRNAQSNAAKLENKQISREDLSDHEMYHVMSLPGHAAINYIDGHDHDGSGTPNQRSPIGQIVDDAHEAGDAGDWNGLKSSVFQVVAPQLSMHDKTHANYYQGYRGPYPADPNDPNGHMQQAKDLFGAHATLQAAASSDPIISKKIIAAHNDGATDDFRALQHFAYRIGGIDQLPKFMQPDEKDHEYLSAKKAGYSDQDAYLISHAPGILQEREQAKALAPLHQAQIAEAYAGAEERNAQARYTDTIKGRKAETITGSDGQLYYLDPINRTITDQAGNLVPPGTMKFSKFKAEGASGDVTERDLFNRASVAADKVIAADSSKAGDYTKIHAQILKELRAQRDADKQAASKGKQAAQGAPRPPPKIGEVVNGHRYMGGDPAAETSWAKVKANGG